MIWFSKAGVLMIAVLAALPGLVRGGSGMHAMSAEKETVLYRGCCDASAAVPVAPELFAVANDEDNMLRVYRRGEGGDPVCRFDLNDFLRTGKKRSECDLEGAARMGERVYWISSHGRNKEGKRRSARYRFFAMRFTTEDGAVDWQPVGTAYERLLDDLLRDTRLQQFGLDEAAKRAPKDQGGLNIEGLCGTPDGRLLIGFRNPQPQGNALVVPLNNPDGVVTGQPAVFGESILLDLGGLGVRGMARIEQGYLLIAGGYDGGEASCIYYWQGVGGVLRRLEGVNLDDYNPEALIVWPEEKDDSFWILSDDGTRRVDGKKCKKLKDESSRSFRAWRVMPVGEEND